MGTCLCCDTTDRDLGKENQEKENLHSITSRLINTDEKELEENIRRQTFKDEIKVCRLINIYDGDTADVVFLDGYREFVRYPLRFYGFDTPEIRPPKHIPEEKRQKEIKAAYEAKNELINFIENKIIIIRFCKNEKYGRLMGDVYAFPKKSRKIKSLMNNLENEDYLMDLVDRVKDNKKYSVASYMIESRFAKPYFGGKKEEFEEKS
jgi:endonuclease YncB( thermonuclease family)